LNTGLAAPGTNEKGYKMKSIKITVANKKTIEAVLAAVNGKAEAHTYTTYTDIADLAESANGRVLRILGAKKYIPGAVLNALSGDAVSNAYARKGFSRAGTLVSIECRSTGWFFVAVSRCDVYKEGGYESLTLTTAQDARAVAVVRAQYRIARV